MATIVRDLISYLQCGESIAANDAIYIDSSTGKVGKFDATDSTQVFAGIAKESGVLDDYIKVVQSGRIKGFSGLTPGQFVYASTTVPGSFQLIDPGPSQKVVLGIAVSATELNINGGLGIKPGGEGGGGGLDVYYIENMEGLNDTSDFATGNNATFLGGGTLQGTLAVESVSPISGLKSLKYTQAAGSLNDYFASDIIDVDLKQQNNDSGMTLYFEYSGADNDMNFVVWDVTNNQRLSSETAFVKLTGKATRYSLSFYVPTSCTQIRWGAQVLVENIGAELVIDDVEISTDPFMEGELIQMTDWESYTPVITNLTVGNGSLVGFYRRVGDTVESRISFTYGSTSVVGALAVTPPNNLSFDSSKRTNNDLAGHWKSLDSSTGTLREGFVRLLTNALALTPDYNGVAGTSDVNATTPFTWATGDTLQIEYAAPVLGWTSSTPHILSPVDTFSTDTAPLTYAGSSQYTLSTLANAPVGTFITFTYAINTNTRTQTNAAPPTQTTADMNVNGIRIFTRAYNAASTAGNPAAIAIQIGKGLKGVSLGLYKSAGKVTAGNLDYSYETTTTAGTFSKDYNEITGILVVDAGFVSLTTNTSHLFAFSDATGQNNGYLTINASKSAALTAVPTPLVAYLKDVKTSGTAGGTFTSGAWQTRTLNTLEGDTSFVTLSANQFTLPAGRYEIEASAPAYTVGSHKVKIYSVTDAVDVIIGYNSFSEGTAGGTSGNEVTRSGAVGTFSISSSKVFELQHRGTITVATNGFGLENNIVDAPEVYSQVKIKKVG